MYRLSSAVLLASSAQATQYTWQSGIQPELKTTGDGSYRTFSTVRSMLVALACNDWDQNNSDACPFKVRDYFRALRNYGCNCYPDNFDEVFQDTNVELWHFGHNGLHVDNVDEVCHNSFVQMQCYEMDGCIKGTQFEYHIAADGSLTCGPETDANYASDPDGNACELYACQIEKSFAEEVWPLIGDPRDFQSDNNENYNVFKKNECTRSSGFKTSKGACCGDFPSRIPFDELKQECCTDGTVQLTGFC